MSSVDYRALLRDHREKQSRPIIRQVVCLVPSLYADLEEAEDNLRAALVATIKPDSDDEDDRGPQVDRRGGGAIAEAEPDLEVVAAREAVRELADEMASKSITLVFKSLSADDQAAEWDSLNREREANPGGINAIVANHARSVLLRCFDHAEGPGREVLDLNREDITPLIEDSSSGLVITTAERLQNASAGAPDLPKSVQRSLRSRRSSET